MVKFLFPSLTPNNYVVVGAFVIGVTFFTFLVFYSVMRVVAIFSLNTFLYRLVAVDAFFLIYSTGKIMAL